MPDLELGLSLVHRSLVSEFAKDCVRGGLFELHAKVELVQSGYLLAEYGDQCILWSLAPVGFTVEGYLVGYIRETNDGFAYWTAGGQFILSV